MKTIKKIFKYLFIGILLIVLGFITWLLIPGKNYNLIETPRKSTQYWELNTGSKIAYTHVQSKTDSVKATLIYLHGGPGGYITNLDIKKFEEISNQGYEIYLYDQIGCGLSERLKDPEEYSIARHIADLKEIINKVNPKRTVLIGQSWGGMFGAYYAATYPLEINKLILTCPGGIMPADTIAQSKYASSLVSGLTSIDKRIDKINVEIQNSMSLKEKLWLAGASLIGSPILISDDKVDGVFNNLSKIFEKGMVCDSTLKSEPGGRPGMYCSIFTTKSLEKLSTNIRTKIVTYKNPVLILKGECDYIPWRETYEYKALFPNSELKVIKSAGHSIARENKKDLVKEILSFLEKE
ncbi:alpha/beta hydrolase [Chryseobacterium indologenes]|uniref:alpha/beta hydrolase n=1 Tax=Chryseobacterium indologenes TaxID=253 RepID=UPI003018759E